MKDLAITMRCSFFRQIFPQKGNTPYWNFLLQKIHLCFKKYIYAASLNSHVRHNYCRTLLGGTVIHFLLYKSMAGLRIVSQIIFGQMYVIIYILHVIIQLCLKLYKMAMFLERTICRIWQIKKKTALYTRSVPVCSVVIDGGVLCIPLWPRYQRMRTLHAT